MPSINASMENLPEEVMVDILSRLPVKTIIHCKCVCKNWQNLVFSSYFINLHLSRSSAGLMIHHEASMYGILKWVEIEDKHDHHHLHEDPFMNFDFNRYLVAAVPAPVLCSTWMIPVGSVNGLICILQCGDNVDNVYICNPITREYLTLPRQQNYKDGYGRIFYNFGVSSLTGEYKVLRILQVDIPTSTEPSLLEAEAYTLGTSQWRSLGQVPYPLDGFRGPFLNGYFHWIVDYQGIFSFDLDNETFQSFPSPPIESKAIEDRGFQDLAVLRGCLCRYDICHSQFTIWVMKEYGIKKSWHKEVVINQTICPDLGSPIYHPVVLIEGLKDGSILMVYGSKLLAYRSQSKTFRDLGIRICLRVLPHRPSFLKLQNIDSERVHVF